MKFILRHIFLIAIIHIVIVYASVAQSKFDQDLLGGLNLSSEVYPLFEFRPYYSFVLEKKLSINNGFEAGMISQRKKNSTLFYDNKVYSVSRKYFSIYGAYRHYAKSYVLTVGPVISFLSSWQNNGAEPIIDYKEDPNTKMGFIFKIGKQFKVADRILIEPELGFHNFYALNLRGITNSGNAEFAAGTSLKYSINRK